MPQIDVTDTGDLQVTPDPQIVSLDSYRTALSQQIDTANNQLSQLSRMKRRCEIDITTVSNNISHLQAQLDSLDNVIKPQVTAKIEAIKLKE